MRSLLVLLFFLMISCKSNPLLHEKKEPVPISVVAVDSARSPEAYFATKLNFSTAYIKCNAHYETDKQSQQVTAELKIKKDEKIIISIRFMGITMAKALITPTQVQYYEKLNSSYFDGNFEAISQFVGTDLNFQKLQNVLLGQAIEVFPPNECHISEVENTLKIERDKGAEAFITYFFERASTQLQKQIIQQPLQERILTVSYPTHNLFSQNVLPAQLEVQAVQKQAQMKLLVKYTDITFDEDLTFPYAVPEGYKRIVIN